MINIYKWHACTTIWKCGFAFLMIVYKIMYGHFSDIEMNGFLVRFCFKSFTQKYIFRYTFSICISYMYNNTFCLIFALMHYSLLFENTVWIGNSHLSHLYYLTAWTLNIIYIEHYYTYNIHKYNTYTMHELTRNCI